MTEPLNYSYAFECGGCGAIMRVAFMCYRSTSVTARCPYCCTETTIHVTGRKLYPECIPLSPPKESKPEMKIKTRVEVRIKSTVDPISKRTTFYLQERVWWFFWVTRVTGAASGFDAWDQFCSRFNNVKGSK